MVANYWIFKVKDEVGGIYGVKGFELFQHRAREGFWGLREYNEKGRLDPCVAELKKGDCVLFYLVGAGGSRFLGTSVLDSGFVKLDPQKAKEIIHQDYLDWDQGVFLSKVERWAKPLPIECLRGKDSFVGGGGKFGSYFQGSIKKIKRKEEYDTIIHEHELFALGQSR